MISTYDIMDDDLKFLEDEKMFLFFVFPKTLILTDIDNGNCPLGKDVSIALKHFGENFFFCSSFDLFRVANEIESLSETKFVLHKNGKTSDFYSIENARENDIINRICKLLERYFENKYFEEIEQLNKEKTKVLYTFCKFIAKASTLEQRLGKENTSSHPLFLYNSNVMLNFSKLINVASAESKESKEIAAYAYEDILFQAVCVCNRSLKEIVTEVLKEQNRLLKEKERISILSDSDFKQELVDRISHYGNCYSNVFSLFDLYFLSLEACKRFFEIDLNKILERAKL